MLETILFKDNMMNSLKKTAVALGLLLTVAMGTMNVASGASATKAFAGQRTGQRNITEATNLCWATLSSDMKSCKSNCTVCAFSVLWICVSFVTVEPCFSDCIADAQAKYKQCARIANIGS